MFINADVMGNSHETHGLVERRTQRIYHSQGDSIVWKIGIRFASQMRYCFSQMTTMVTVPEGDRDSENT